MDLLTLCNKDKETTVFVSDLLKVESDIAIVYIQKCIPLRIIFNPLEKTPCKYDWSWGTMLGNKVNNQYINYWKIILYRKTNRMASMHSHLRLKSLWWRLAESLEVLPGRKMFFFERCDFLDVSSCFCKLIILFLSYCEFIHIYFEDTLDLWSMTIS